MIGKKKKQPKKGMMRLRDVPDNKAIFHIQSGTSFYRIVNRKGNDYWDIQEVSEDGKENIGIPHGLRKDVDVVVV
jgi:hypothetical protein